MTSCSQPYMIIVEFSDLPNEIAIHIFSYLSLHTVRCVLPLVCHRWRELCKSSLLWRDMLVGLKLGPNWQYSCFSKISSMWNFVKATPEVQNLLFDGRADEINLTKVMKLVCLRAMNIRKLSVSQDLNYGQLKSLQCTLKDLEIDYNICFDVSNIKHLKSLRKLTVRGSLDKEQLIDLIQECPKIEFLNTIDSELDGGCKFKLNTTKIQSSQLKTLWINFSRLTVDELEEISKLPRLERIGAYELFSSGSRLRYLSRLPLHHLHLEEALTSVFTTKMVLAFFFMQIYSSIHSLNLEYIPLNDEAAREIRKNCPNLISFNCVVLDKGDGSFLTTCGFHHLLHLPLLRTIEIRFIHPWRDWFYRRQSWQTIHSCDPMETCSRNLLSDWVQLRDELQDHPLRPASTDFLKASSSDL